MQKTQPTTDNVIEGYVALFEILRETNPELVHEPIRCRCLSCQMGRLRASKVARSLNLAEFPAEEPEVA